MKTWQKYAAEAYGTFVLVGLGTGAVMALRDFDNAAFVVTVALAFGLALIVGIFTVGHVSGGHFNPAVSFGAFLDRRIGLTDMIGYWVSQLVGAVLASLVFVAILDRTSVASSANALKPDVTSFGGLLAEVVLTAVFVMIILVVSKGGSETGLLAIGLTLAAVHLVGIGFTGTSVNPARSFAPALVGGAWSDFWVFVVGPFVGAALGWLLFKVVVEGETNPSAR
jgi:aquaporin Z